jgi:hypothetical protein
LKMHPMRQLRSWRSFIPCRQKSLIAINNTTFLNLAPH